ncbi:kinase-like domain-containing protein, partial [Mycena galericulata]
CKEALVWQGLRHQFILPFLGIDRRTFPSAFCLVAPWMKNGTVLKYLKERGLEEVNRLFLEIAQGLEYLHSKNIVHGDLRGSNILISDDFHACLADFGLATTVSISDTEATTYSPTSSKHAGSVRWFAPELISPQQFGCEKFVRTPATDVYAFACVCVELHTGNPPFSESVDAAAMLKVIAGERPQRPVTVLDGTWNLVNTA